jgi:hypothetical protein
MELPGDVRGLLLAALPPGFDIQAVSWQHARAWDLAASGTYQAYIPHATARNRGGLVAALAARRGAGARAELLRHLPPHADPGLPVCRDVWSLSPRARRPYKQRAFDVLFEQPTPPPVVPVTANVVLFADTDTAFAAPLGVELNVQIKLCK